MSYCSTNILKSDARISDVIEFIQLLGYKLSGSFASEEVGKITSFYWFNEIDYSSWSGVELSIYLKDTIVNIETRTPIARSYFDLEHQNKTIRLLRKYFGGSFETDEGKNRYLYVLGDPPTPAQSGSHIAFQRFGSNLITSHLYFKQREFKGPKPQTQSEIYWLDRTNPALISNNLLLPFLVSAFEDYWKSTYIALLKYSNRKEVILKSGRLSPNQLTAIADGNISLEQAFAEGMSFQRISVICNNFKTLDSELDFAGVLRKPYRRRKVSLYESLEKLTDLRNEIIHCAEIKSEITNDFVLSQFYDLHTAIIRSYKYLTQKRSWKYHKWWHAGIS